MAIVDNAFREWIADFKAANPSAADSRAILDTAQYAFAAGRKAQREIDAARQPVGDLGQFREAVEMAMEVPLNSAQRQSLQRLLALIDSHGVRHG